MLNENYETPSSTGKSYFSVSVAHILLAFDGRRFWLAAIAAFTENKNLGSEIIRDN